MTIKEAYLVINVIAVLIFTISIIKKERKNKS